MILWPEDDTWGGKRFPVLAVQSFHRNKSGSPWSNLASERRCHPLFIHCHLNDDNGHSVEVRTVPWWTLQRYYILRVAEIAEEAAWPQVPSPLSKSHIICFSTEPMKMTILLGSNTTATEYKDAMVMTCCTNVISTQWLFNGLSLQLRESTDVSWCSRGDPHRVFCALGSSHDGIQDCGSQCHSMEKRKGIV